jgi:hypothetical protein
MKQLIIDRTVWYRGAGGNPEVDSALRTDHGMYCCLGIDAKACGFTDDQLGDGDTPSPGTLFRVRGCPVGDNPLPGLVHWDPEDNSYENTDVAGLMMEVNDAEVGEDWFVMGTAAIATVEGLREYLDANAMTQGERVNEKGIHTTHVHLSTEEQREAILTLCFRSIGREVTFIN